ncbi:hypothetical protein IWQ61_009588 [Dispira simplex]|nr:hypothetical protein IWQ61_009588 [Dispira simplex]
MRTFYILLAWTILTALALAGKTPKTSVAESTGKDHWSNFFKIFRALEHFKTSASSESRVKTEFPDLQQFPLHVLSFLFDRKFLNPPKVPIPDQVKNAFWKVVFGTVEVKNEDDAKRNVQAVDTLLDNVNNVALHALLLAQQSRVFTKEEAGAYSTILHRSSLAPNFAKECYAQPAIYLFENGRPELALKLFAAQLKAVPENGKGKGKEIVGVDVEDEEEVEENIQPSKLFYPAWHFAQDIFIYRALKTKYNIKLTDIIEIQPYKGERANILLGLAVFALKRRKQPLTSNGIDCSKVKTEHYELCNDLGNPKLTDEDLVRLLRQSEGLLTELHLSDDKFNPEQAAKSMGIVSSQTRV